MENKVENHEKNFLILKLLKRNWLLMAIITILITLCFIAYNIAFTKPVYTASRSFILRTELVGGTEMANGALAVDVLLPQIEDNFTSQKYNQMANEEYQKSEYVKHNDSTISRNAITFIYNEGSLIARLAYTDADAKVAVEKLKAVFNTANAFFADGENSQAYTIRLIPTDNSEYDYSRFVVTENSSTSKYIILGIIAGLAISFIVVIIKNSLDNTVKDKHELEELTDLNVLAIIDKM
ncbi:MAG: hypothetical protein J6V71_01350 [Clostridia bacterium]|nr:hypothetical protein [Clostridia bacterium]